MNEDKYNGWNDDGGLQPIEKCPFCGGSAKLCDNGFEVPIIDPDSGAYVDMEISEGDRFSGEPEGRRKYEINRYYKAGR